MAFFGFGKKKKKSQKPQKRTILSLNRRSFPRYMAEGVRIDVGKIKEIAKDSLLVEGAKREEGERMELRVEGERYEGEVVRIQGESAAIRLFGEFSSSIVARAASRPLHRELPRGAAMDFASLVDRDEEIQKSRAIINLMLEIEDPNTNVHKLKESIEALPDLHQKILTIANAVEVAGRGRVEDVGTAVGRLGFDNLKRIVYEYVEYEALFQKAEFSIFKDQRLFTIFLGAVFKKIAPLVNFIDPKNEGQSLVTMSGIGAWMVSRGCAEVAGFYRDVESFLRYEMRLLERKGCGYDLWELNARYFLDYLGVFRYLFEGTVLGYMMYEPRYGSEKISILPSNRKFRFAYAYYLALLAQKWVFGQDRVAGYAFLKRLQRVGLEVDEAMEWVWELIAEVNGRVRKAGFEKRIHEPVAPMYVDEVAALVGKGVYGEYFLQKMELFGKEGQRAAIAFEDGAYTHMVLEALLRSEEAGLIQKSFCVLPCEMVRDDELPLALFEGFDLVVMRNLDRLDPALLKDFQKIWRDFEGKILVTFSKDSMIEYSNPALYETIREQIVDFPSYFKSELTYERMISNGCQRLEKFLDRPVCEKIELPREIFTLDTLYAMALYGK
ncbi:MAG: HDOD domain-containing protein [Epsilonproteobacteria bacterium]|nr:HDOD domain-containing protein [Campylobacterota bacterium]